MMARHCLLSGAFFCLNMVLITLSSFLSAIIINLYMRVDKKNKVPDWLRVVCCLLSVLRRTLGQLVIINGGLVFGRRPLGAILHSSNKPGELSQWLCHDDSTINIVVLIIIIIIIIIMSPFISSSGLSPGSCEAKVQSTKVCLNCTEPSVARSSCWSLPVDTDSQKITIMADLYVHEVEKSFAVSMSRLHLMRPQDVKFRPSDTTTGLLVLHLVSPREHKTICHVSTARHYYSYSYSYNTL